MATSDGEGRRTISRRAWTRLAILGASGLSFLPGCLLRKSAGGDTGSGTGGADGDGGPVTTCYEPIAGPPPEPAKSLLSKWALLGWIWRQMSLHLKGEPFDAAGEADFKALQVEMNAALDALPAWPELREVFEQRWEHIQRSHYVAATCYEMMLGGPPPARGAVEEQVKALEDLVAEGKLTEEAARKAAHVLGVQAEYLRRLEETGEKPDGSPDWEVWDQLWKQYEAGQIEPGPQAELAGERLAELTVDKLGWLAGPPEPEDDEDAEAEPDREEGDEQ